MQLVTGLSSGSGSRIRVAMMMPNFKGGRLVAKKKVKRERRGEESERKRSREERCCGAKQPRERKMNAVYKVDIGERAWTVLTM